MWRSMNVWCRYDLLWCSEIYVSYSVTSSYGHRLYFSTRRLKTFKNYIQKYLPIFCGSASTFHIYTFEISFLSTTKRKIGRTRKDEDTFIEIIRTWYEENQYRLDLMLCFILLIYLQWTRPFMFALAECDRWAYLEGHRRIRQYELPVLLTYRKIICIEFKH